MQNDNTIFRTHLAVSKCFNAVHVVMLEVNSALAFGLCTMLTSSITSASEVCPKVLVLVT